VAKGAADMVRQMVGQEVPLAWCGGNPVGGPGNERRCHREVTPCGLVGSRRRHHGGYGRAETNSEMAIERLPEKRRTRVVVCNAPIVEGSVMAATESSAGSPLEKVRRAAEELYLRS